MGDRAFIKVRAKGLIFGRASDAADDEPSLIVVPGTIGYLAAAKPWGHEVVWDRAYIQSTGVLMDELEWPISVDSHQDAGAVLEFIEVEEVEEEADEADPDPDDEDPDPDDEESGEGEGACPPPDDAPLSAAQVAERTGLDEAAIDDRIQAGTFPLPDGYVSLQPYWERETIRWWEKRLVAKATSCRPSAEPGTNGVCGAGHAPAIAGTIGLDREESVLSGFIEDLSDEFIRFAKAVTGRLIGRERALEERPS